MATIGLPKSLSDMPVARHSARAPAAFRPCVVVRERSWGISTSGSSTALCAGCSPRRTNAAAAPGFPVRSGGRRGKCLVGAP